MIVYPKLENLTAFRIKLESRTLFDEDNNSNKYLRGVMHFSDIPCNLVCTCPFNMERIAGANQEAAVDFLFSVITDGLKGAFREGVEINVESNT